jgi:hypothetical protein
MRKNSTPDLKSSDSKQSSGLSTRREFLKGSAVVAATTLVIPATIKSVEPERVPTVDFCGHKVTRLITGANPLYGYSHFNMIMDATYLEYFTDERVVEFMLNCERAGINSWQGNFAARAQRQYPMIRDAGCKMNFIALSDPWDFNRGARSPEEQHAALMKQLSFVAGAKPILIAHHGNVTDNLFRAGKLEMVRTFIDKVHDMGFPAGVSTHNPAVITEVEGKGWPVDFYQACFYRQSRNAEDYQKEMNVVPEGEAYLSTDPAVMCKVVRQVSKPCLGFKILAAGRKCGSPESVQGAFKFAYENIKPTDVLIVGMFPKYKDQITENTGYARRFGGIQSDSRRAPIETTWTKPDQPRTPPLRRGPGWRSEPPSV